jgi:hypothetical protein
MTFQVFQDPYEPCHTIDNIITVQKTPIACNNVVENRPEKYFAAHILFLVTILFSIVNNE